MENCGKLSLNYHEICTSLPVLLISVHLLQLWWVPLWSKLFGQKGLGKQCRSRRSSLIRVDNVYHSVCIFWRHMCMLKPDCSGFKIITAFLAHWSRRLTRWAYSPSVIHSFEQKYLQDQLAYCSQILSVASLGWGKGCIRFLGRSDQNCGYHGNRKLPLTYNGKNSVSAFSQSPLIWIFVKLAGNKDRHKILDEFVGQGQTFHYRVIHPWAFPLTLNGENGVSIFSQLLWIQLLSNLQATRTGLEAWTSSNFGHVGPVILELRAFERWKKWCLQLFSVIFESLSNLHVMRTGIKAWMSLNLG